MVKNLLYVWQVYRNGQWGIIRGINMKGGLEKIPLISRFPDEAMAMRPLAIVHGSEHKCPIRLVTYSEDAVLETISP